MNSNNGSNVCPTCGKTISFNNSARAACLAVPQPPRWDAETSPLTISFWFGSPAAPDSIKEQVVLEPGYGEHDGYMLLPWREALAVLHRANVEWFEFHPDDLNWQVNGWKLLDNGLLPVTPLSEDELRQWSHLAENPTTADFAAEVMHQYLADIDVMSYSKDTAQHIHQTVYGPLKACLDAWTDTALVGLPHPDHVVLRVDVRQLLKRAYEIAYAGHSDINPLNEAGELDSILFRSAVRETLVPSRRFEFGVVRSTDIVDL
jgi:hypothetical protein